MPENFASLLEALDAEGRALARPVPAGVIETRARGRRRHRRFTAAASVAAVCAIAAGAALGFGGTKADSEPVKPLKSATPAPSTPSASQQAPGSKNRVGADALLLPSEPPQPGLLQWKRKVFKAADSPTYTVPICGGGQPGPPKKSRAQSEITAGYDASDLTSGQETIYHYSSAAAAQQDFDVLKPDAARCPGVKVIATVEDGFAWQDLVQGLSSLHRMIVLSGTDIAYWFYDYPGGIRPYDISDDQAALQRMADRLDGGTPVPDRVTAPPAGTLPDSAWLDPSQIPLATADESHGWVPFGTQQESAGGAPAADLCEAVTDGDNFVSAAGASILTRTYHGSPDKIPVYSGSNYLYSGAYQHIVAFSGGPDQAATAYSRAEAVIESHGCKSTDGSGRQATRTVKIGTVTDSGFSIVASDSPGPGYAHLYCVVKGAHVSWLMISYEHGDTSTGGDAGVLAAMAARLP